MSMPEATRPHLSNSGLRVSLNPAAAVARNARYDGDAVVVMAKHIKDPPPAFALVAAGAEIPPELERVVGRALAKTPQERIQSAEQFITDLESALGDAERAGHRVSETTTAALAAVERPTPPHKRPRARWLIAALALSGLGVAAAFVSTLGAWQRAPSAGVEQSVTHAAPAALTTA